MVYCVANLLLSSRVCRCCILIGWLFVPHTLGSDCHRYTGYPCMLYHNICTLHIDAIRESFAYISNFPKENFTPEYEPGMHTIVNIISIISQPSLSPSLSIKIRLAEHFVQESQRKGLNKKLWNVP